MEFVAQLPKEQKYLLGVSGGCDSMCLLDLCFNNHLNIVVVTINYNLRKNASFEENIVKEYCDKRNIPFYAYHPKKEVTGNFQAWAREARYNFYKIVYDFEKCDVLLLGHQLDDHIETYLMGKQRNSHGWYYGINPKTYHHGMHIIRPIINMRKNDTRYYCEINQVLYHDDESNFTNHYQRNVVRHDLIETADEAQINEWVMEINKLNFDLVGKIAYVEAQYLNSEYIDIERYRNEIEEARVMIIRRMVYMFDHKIMLSNDLVIKLDKDILSGKNGYYEVANRLELVHEYGKLYVNIVPDNYAYTFEKVEFGENEYFKIVESGRKKDGITLLETDFPITIRNYHIADSILMRYGTKRVSRFFIDNKISRKERLRWPVVENKDHKVIFVAELGCDINHYSIKPSIYVLK